ncbi:ubiquitin-like-conjugating enzyme ATG10 [Rutidosis leptorrhynchoides]|uniref:ubiquitin-like-conjugating enzyme ATG10 n=1 Tax=Rutidosis leptorrhynchoides TaxID=125765 RepID=UPI003A98ED48
MVFDKETCSGSLSSSDFRIAANAFAEKWNKFNSGFPDWLWIDCSNRLGFVARSDGYLSIQNVILQTPFKEERDEGTSDDIEEPFDDATLVESNDEDGHEYEFHIVYSPCYRVPVLYFRAHNNEGQPLNLDQIEKNLPTKSSKVLIESKWTFITLQEHPYLDRPWYTLHPCGTSDWMKLLGATDNSTEGGIDQYLVSWFSVVGQVFGLELPFEMFKRSS